MGSIISCLRVEERQNLCVKYSLNQNVRRNGWATSVSYKAKIYLSEAVSCANCGYLCRNLKYHVLTFLFV